MYTAHNTDFMQKKDNKCYAILYYNDVYETMPLPCYPDSINDSLSAQWNPQQILGRTASIAAYTGTSDQDISFNIKLHREMGIEMGIDIEKVLQFLRKTVYPKYGSIGLKPPTTKFVFGKTAMYGYVKSVSFGWSGTIIDGLYQVCDVGINLTSDPNNTYGVDDLGTSYNPFNVIIDDI